MGTIKSLNKWANAHTYYPVDLARIMLGIFLFYKGTTFLSSTQYLVDIVKPLNDLGGTLFLIHYVAPAHLIGGVLIAFGLLTCWAVIAQLPILLGAVAINFIGEMNANNLITSSVVLILSICFMVYGSGKHSADYHLKMQQ